jgi:membrane-associated PAP2 superfamily phosphatase
MTGMYSSSAGSPGPFHWLAALVVATLAWLSAVSGVDHALAAAAFDPATRSFPARDWVWLELVGHRLAKYAVWVVWGMLLAAAIASYRVPSLAPRRRALWAAAAAMAAGPAIVGALKAVTGPRCPWDLREFGGAAGEALVLFTGTADAGRCFPSGHASGGFSLLALYFAGLALGDARIRRIGLWSGLVAGGAFSLVQMVRGAHFLSHNLWSAVVDWLAAALVFAIAFRAASGPRAPQSGPAA